MTDRYAAAGVRLDAADDAKRRIAALVRTTRTPYALGEIGAFGGMVRVPSGYERPVLVLSTDGVGTKVLVAARAGIHDTVGEDLVNHCVNDILGHGVRDPFPDTGRTVAQVLLDVHTSYAAAVTPVLPRLHALAHITGGGIPGNLVRVLPAGCEAVVDARAWSWPPVFRVLRRAGEVSLGEMRRVFNLGVGMIAVAARDDTEAVIASAKRAGIAAWIIGEVRAGTQGVKFAER